MDSASSFLLSFSFLIMSGLVFLLDSWEIEWYGVCRIETDPGLDQDPMQTPFFSHFAAL